jgi:CRP/FNR family transcriptional regulator
MRGATVAARSGTAAVEHRAGWELPKTPVSRPLPPPSDRPGGGNAQPVPRGHRLPLNGSPSDPVTVVQSGWIALFKALPGDRSICIGILGPGDLFFHDRSCTQNEIAAESLVDAVLLQEDFQRLVGVLSGSPALVQAALISLRRQATDMQDLVSRVLSRDITLRLAAVLIALSDRFGRSNADGTTSIAIPVAHKMLARMIGSNRVTVTRVMTEMREAGMVKAPGRNQVVVDNQKLKSYLNGGAQETWLAAD